MGFKSLASILLLGLVLTGCGGGGGGGSGDSDDGGSDSNNSDNNTTSTSPETPTTPTANSDCIALGEIFDDLLAETNIVRAENGVANLQFSYQLGQAAQGHAADMATNNFFSHTSPTGSTIASRIDASDYVYSSAGENIAAGYDSVEEVVQAWFDSPSHRENLLNPDYVDIGFGLSFEADSEYGSYWVQEFGRPTDETTVDTRAYIPDSCSIGAIASGNTAVSDDTAISNDTAVLSGKLTAGTSTDGSINHASITVASHSVEPIDTPEPALVFSLVSVAIGLGFTKVKH